MHLFYSFITIAIPTHPNGYIFLVTADLLQQVRPAFFLSVLGHLYGSLQYWLSGADLLMSPQALLFLVVTLPALFLI
mgnify:CR=1 FL=1